MEDEIYDVLDAINVQRENDKWTKTSPFPPWERGIYRPIMPPF